MHSWSYCAPLQSLASTDRSAQIPSNINSTLLNASVPSIPGLDYSHCLSRYSKCGMKSQTLNTIVCIFTNKPQTKAAVVVVLNRPGVAEAVLQTEYYPGCYNINDTKKVLLVQK